MLAFAFFVAVGEATTASEYMEPKTDTISNPFAYIHTKYMYSKRLCIPKAKEKKRDLLQETATKTLPTTLRKTIRESKIS